MVSGVTNIIHGIQVNELNLIRILWGTVVNEM